MMITSSFSMLVIIASLSLIIGVILGIFATLLWVDYIRKEKPAISSTGEETIQQTGAESERNQEYVEQNELINENKFQEMIRFGYTESGSKLAAVMDEKLITDPQVISKEKVTNLKFFIASLNNWFRSPEQIIETHPARTDLDATIPISHVKRNKKNFNGDEGNSIRRDGNKKSIAYQVNVILQSLLREQTEITQSVSIKDGKAGSLVFQIGEETFADIASIPYPEVKSLIEKAAEAWNEQEKNKR